MDNKITYRVTPVVYKENNLIKLYAESEYQNIYEHIVKQHICTVMIDLNNQATRESLIKLGWTPPNEN